MWRSFSSNNSGAFYLVATFATADQARKVENELRTFLARDAAELQSLPDDQRWGYDTLTMAGLEFGDKHGVDWNGRLVYGEGEDEELDIATVDSVLVVSHHYCTGFAPEMEAVLTAQGGRVETATTSSSPRLSLILEVPAGDVGQAVLSAVGDWFACGGNARVLGSGGWREDTDVAAGFYDGHTAGFTAPFWVPGLSALKELLNDVPNYSMAVDVDDDLERFRAIGRGRCSECDTQLRFLERTRYGTTNDQLVCDRCGGMFELTVFVAPVS